MEDRDADPLKRERMQEINTRSFPGEAQNQQCYGSLRQSEGRKKDPLHDASCRKEDLSGDKSLC